MDHVFGGKAEANLRLGLWTWTLWLIQLPIEG
jgi:hypothetical protein